MHAQKYITHCPLLILLPRDRLVRYIYFLIVCDLDARELRREVRTCASHCDAPHYLYQSAFLDRHLHIILKYKKLKIYKVDRAVTDKTF